MAAVPFATAALWCQEETGKAMKDGNPWNADCLHLKGGWGGVGSSGTFCPENILLRGKKPELQGLQNTGSDFILEKCS